MGFWFSLRKEPTNEPTIEASSGIQILVPTAPISPMGNTDIKNIIIPPIASGWTTVRFMLVLLLLSPRGVGAGRGRPGSLCRVGTARGRARGRPVSRVGPCRGRGHRGAGHSREHSAHPSPAPGVRVRDKRHRELPEQGTNQGSAQSLLPKMPEGGGSVQSREGVTERGLISVTPCLKNGCQGDGPGSSW